MCYVMAIGLAIMAVTTALTATESVEQGQAANKQAKYQADYQKQAQAVTDADTQRKIVQQQATQQAAFASAGVDPTLGSAADVQASSAADAGRDLYESDLRAQNQEDQTLTAGKNAQTTANNQAFTSIISSVGKAFSAGTGGGAGAGATGGGGFASLFS